jgi:hypothetical protein
MNRSTQDVRRWMAAAQAGSEEARLVEGPQPDDFGFPRRGLILLFPGLSE